MASHYSEKFPSKRMIFRLLTDYFGSEESAFAIMRRFAPLKLSFPSAKEVEKMRLYRKVVNRAGPEPTNESVSAAAMVFGISVSEVRKIIKTEAMYEKRLALGAPATKRRTKNRKSPDNRSSGKIPKEWTSYPLFREFFEREASRGKPS